MAGGYYDEEAFLNDYRKLSEEYQGKVDRYMRKLLQIQRAEQKVTAKVHSMGLDRREEMRTVIRCSFCGKHQDDCERIVAGPHAYICDECIRLCGKILVEEEAKPEGEVPDGPAES